MTSIPASKCINRPDCPCEFCMQSRAEFAEGRTPGQELDGLASEWIGDYSAAEVANINPGWISAVEWNFDRSEDLRVFGTPLPKDYPRALPAKYI
jgi:hypothetical protein